MPLEKHELLINYNYVILCVGVSGYFQRVQCLNLQLSLKRAMYRLIFVMTQKCPLCQLQKMTKFAHRN